ncbi:DISARM system SNF2-like helicase DrmD [Endozoicomonas gorgoniicola]|uniref:DISARM system SNF2-like helicase DrmD n=1 Tax=Endozoicomonas gorgoniicola TaxID=1234144 RepID=A0ABT3MR23_9GAMM|nr:DISARM system SNF2-like helicase DrmD [Endozoicomonas gorgoniicola]MCW7551828.1 DISARM system SNF2-like helicase DrmD [Endozoicomonas gorgoniicola]
MSIDTAHSASIPRVGMLATVRNRRGVISAVESISEGRASSQLHLVTVEFSDAEGDAQESLLWERERSPVVLEPNALPRIDAEAPMVMGEFMALQRATRWSALTPFLSAHSLEKRSEPVPTAPVYGAVSVDDFQMVPLARAMRMPRVSLLLADDVGLGKTIEAGLILAELIRTRRIRRVLIITPASLRTQWQQEMDEKFSLGFDVVDKAFTHKLQKEMGLDANPWRALPRIITSYHYLRQPDVLEQFIANCEASRGQGHAQLPWDLLIVDEAHNLMPANYGEDSDLARMLRTLTPYFEHRLFLTATPHNGHTRCFSGLLEQLDPVRFTKTPGFTEKERGMIGDVLIRRLKSEINEQDKSAGRVPRFAKRHLEPLPLYMPRDEKQLAEAVRCFCGSLKKMIQAEPKARMVLNFAIEVLRKRLLSSPVTFADSWLRFKLGLEDSEALQASEVMAARRSIEEDIDDDLERESRGQHAAQVIGGWIHPHVHGLQKEIDAIDAALEALGLNQLPVVCCTPVSDSRFDRLLEMVNKELRNAEQWQQDERLIIFTEYKTTLDYLVNRLTDCFGADEGAIAQLYGGMSDDEREVIKRAFNDPASPVKILVATDAASEGLNLQHTARLLIHYEIPWNPSRLEQRNGRIDRHGQSRDVSIYHFTSDDDADLSFVARVLSKVNDIREDLGSVGELFDAAFQRRMLELNEDQEVLASLELQIQGRRGAADDARVQTEESGEAEKEQLLQLMADLDLSPQTLVETLSVAMELGAPGKVLDGPDTLGRMRLKTPLPSRWQSVVDDGLRLPAHKGIAGAMPWVVFDNQFFIKHVNGRPVFQPSADTVLLHLGHPLFRHALNAFARLRFPSGQTEFQPPSRWLVTRGKVPEGSDALILLTVEELAINELRETFHHWTRTLALPVSGEALGASLTYENPTYGGRVAVNDSLDVERARDLWDGVEQDVKGFITAFRERISNNIKAELAHSYDEAKDREKEAFDRRIKEVQSLKGAQSIEKLKREIEEERSQSALQLDMLEDANAEAEKRLRDLEDELKRRQNQFGDLLDRLKSEKERILKQVLPQRFRLRGEAQVFPVTIEIRLPEARS